MNVDLILPDIAWLEERLDRLDAIFITHAHEDHIGALGHLWPKLKKPVYARRFTATIARLKFEENGLPVERHPEHGVGVRRAVHEFNLILPALAQADGLTEAQRQKREQQIANLTAMGQGRGAAPAG